MTELFLKCTRIILKNEGGYVNDPDDYGKETYRGITRVHFPGWSGWDIIDEIKQETGDIKWNTIINDSYLNNLVFKFYYDYFWTPSNFELLHDENVILQIYDFGINAGRISAIKKAQRIAGVNPDGIIGNATASNINSDVNFIHRYKIERQNYYKAIVRSKPKQAKFLNGWLKRIEECKL